MAEVVEQPVMFFPTIFRFPLWARRRALTLRVAVERFRLVDESFKVRTISPTFEMPRGLLSPFLRPELPVALDPEDYARIMTAEAPVDGVEVVEWMTYSFPENLILSARCIEYNRLGSQMVGNATDPRYPGLIVEDVRVRAEDGATIRRRGYGIVDTPLGSFNVPYPRKADGIFKDLLSWSSCTGYAGAVQWTASLIKWKELAATPIRQSVGFFRDRAGNVAPQFFEQLPPRPALRATVRQRFTSNAKQTIRLSFRDPTNFTRVLGTRDVEIAAGTSEVTFEVTGFPYVPPTVCQAQPSDNTSVSLEEYVVI